MKKIKHFYLTFILLFIPLLIFATDYTISSVDEFNNLSLSAGDNVIWLNGTYSSDERITFSGNGTATNPITLKAETAGGVIFNNGLQIDIAGNYLVIDGFYWNGGYGASNFIQFRNGTNYAQNCTIQNCAINGLTAEPGDAAEAAAEGAIIKHRWIVLYGNNNNVLNCTFMNKNTAGALVLAEYEYNAAENRCNEVGHTIMNNYFYNYEKIDPTLSNSGDSETIRIGTSEYQNVNSAAIVSGNYFVEADGENEIITNKSANNSYLNNTFRRCRGSLVMRHGPNATVSNNYFLGENIEGTGAIRITDSDHNITNNYIQDCVTADNFAVWNNGLTFVGGNTNSVSDCTSTSVSNSYQDVENINFSNNTFVNTNSPIYFNDSRDGADNVFGTVSNNVIYFENSNQNTSNVISGAYSEIGSSLTFSGNVYDGTSLGESVSGFTTTSLTSSSNGEIFNISGASGAGASIPNDPITDSDVGNTVGACFLNATGSNTSSCDGTTIDTLNVSSLNEFSSNGGSQSVSISSNINWTLSENSSWITVNTTSGSNNESVSITAAVNTAASSRSATITISGGNITRTITATQTGNIIVTPGSCTEGTNLSLNATIAEYSSQENTTNNANNTIDGIDTNRWSANGFPQYIVVDLGSSYNINEIGIVPFSNRAYQFTVEGSSISSNSGFNTLVDATNNTDDGNLITRNFDTQNVQFVKLTVTGASGYTGTWASIMDFKIICAGEDNQTPNLDISSISEFSANQQTQNLSVTSNINWTVSENSDWITLSTTNGSNNGTIEITAATNSATTSRSATIIVTGDGITRSINVSQAAADVTNPGIVFTPDPSKKYHIDSPFHNLRLAATGESEDPYTISTSTTGEDVEWVFIDKGNGYWHLQRAAGGTSPRLRTDNSANADMQATAWTGSYTYYEMAEGASNNTYFFTLPDGPTNYKRLQIDNSGAVKMVSTASNGTWESFSITEVSNNNNTTSCTSGTNLALNGIIVDFSAEQNTTNTVTNIIDGNDTNRWSVSGYSQYAVIDLGDEYNVNQVNLLTYDNRDYQFTVEGSLSSANSGFSTLVNASNNTDSGTINRSFSTQTVRYVKLTITGANSYTGTWISIADFEIICAGNSAKTETSSDKVLLKTISYPNPFINTINISVNNNETNIRIIDLSGRIIIKQKLDGNNVNTITNLDHLSKGIYLLQTLNNNQKVIKTSKIIKQ